jgi:CHASE2 domain-containing sensor protein
MLVSTVPSSIIQLAIDAFTAISFAAALLGIAALWYRDRPLAILIALTVAYFLFIAAGGEAEARFRVPVAPMLAIAAAHGFAKGRSTPSR